MLEHVAVQSQRGVVSAELVTDSCVEGDYNHLALGVRAPFRVSQLMQGNMRPVLEQPVSPYPGEAVQGRHVSVQAV